MKPVNPKDFVFGVIFCLVFSIIVKGAPAEAILNNITISFDDKTLKDLYAGCALAGLMANPSPFNYGNDSSIQGRANAAWIAAQELMKARKGK